MILVEHLIGVQVQLITDNL